LGVTVKSIQTYLCCAGYENLLLIFIHFAFASVKVVCYFLKKLPGLGGETSKIKTKHQLNEVCDEFSSRWAQLVRYLSKLFIMLLI